MFTNVSKLVSSTTINYNKTFAEKHTIGALVGFEAEKNVTDFMRSSGNNLPTSSLHTVDTDVRWMLMVKLGNSRCLYFLVWRN